MYDLSLWSSQAILIVYARPMSDLRDEDAFGGHTGAVLSVAFTPDGAHLLTGGADGTVRTWAWPSGRMVRAMRCHRDGVHAIAITDDGRGIVTAGADGIRLSRASDETPGPAVTDQGTDLAAGDVVVAPDGAIVGASDGGVRVWSPDGRLQRVLMVAGVDMAGGMTTRRTPSGGMSVVNVGRARLPRRLWPSRVRNDTDGRITCVTVTPDGTVAAAGDSGLIWLWNSRTGRLIATLRHPEGLVRALAAGRSPHGVRVVSAGDHGAVHVWDARASLCDRVLPDCAWRYRRPLVTLTHPDLVAAMAEVRTEPAALAVPGNVYGVAMLPNGAVVTGGEDRCVRLWDGRDGTLLRTWSGHDGAISDVAVYGDRIVSAGSDGRVLCRQSDHASAGGTLAAAP